MCGCWDKVENWHALSLEQRLLNHHFLDICQCAFNVLFHVSHLTLTLNARPGHLSRIVSQNSSTVFWSFLWHIITGLNNAGSFFVFFLMRDAFWYVTARTKYNGDLPRSNVKSKHKKISYWFCRCNKNVSNVLNNSFVE